MNEGRPGGRSLGSIAPAQTIAVDEDYAAQNAPVIDARLAMALGEERIAGDPSALRSARTSC